MLERPFGEGGAVVGLDLEAEGAGAGVLDRAADPEAGAGGGVERVAAEAAVAEDAVAGAAGGDLSGGIEAEALEEGDAVAGLAGFVGDRFELHAVVEGEDAQLGPVVQAVGGPVDLLELGVVAEGGGADAAVEEELELLPGGVGRGAAVAGDGEGAAGVGVLERGRPVLAGEPALEQAGHEAVAGAEDVEDLDGEAGALLAVVEGGGDGAGEGGGACGAALADQGGGGDGADGAEGGEGVGGAAGDVELLLGADDEVEEVERGLELGGDGGALDEALLAEAVAGEAPEVGAVVDVEGGAGAGLAGEAEGLEDGGLGAGVARGGCRWRRRRGCRR